MHELTLAQGIITTLKKEKKAHNFSKVLRVDIACGLYNCVSKDSLQFCFDTLAEEDWMKKAQIEIDRIAAVYFCKTCKKDFFIEDPIPRPHCPGCDSSEITKNDLRDIFIKRLEVE